MYVYLRVEKIYIKKIYSQKCYKTLKKFEILYKYQIDKRKEDIKLFRIRFIIILLIDAGNINLIFNI